MIGINGITIKLWVPSDDTAADPFNHVSTQTNGEWTDVEDVLVAPMSDTEILDTVNLFGRRATYQMAIPKGDTHDWTDGNFVQFFGEYWRIVGHPTEGIEANIPLRWNKKVRVESIGGTEFQV